MKNKDFDISDWKEISREIAFDNRWRPIEKVVFRRPDGKKDDYYIKKEPKVVCILALTKDKQVILARQYRQGPMQVFDELPGGCIEDDQPLEAAKRELQEETGYRGNIEMVAHDFAAANSTMERYHFVATDCEKVAEQELDREEFIEVVIKSLDDFKKQLSDGQLTDTSTAYRGLHYLGLL